MTGDQDVVQSEGPVVTLLVSWHPGAGPKIHHGYLQQHNVSAVGAERIWQVYGFRYSLVCHVSTAVGGYGNVMLQAMRYFG